MTCKVEQDNIELRRKIKRMEQKQADHIQKIHELLTESKNGTGTNKQNPATDSIGS